MKHLTHHAKWYVVAVLAAANLFIWQPIFATSGANELTIAFLNVGQGDAIFIEAPTGNQMVIDGGPDRALLRELGAVMPRTDRSIDVLLVTNPDKDHYAGFLDVIERYEIGAVVMPGTHSDTTAYRELEKKIAEKGIRAVTAWRGMEIALGDGVVLRVLFPDRDTANWKTNDGSIIAKLVYGDTSVLFTGDSTKLTEGIVARLEGEELKSDILKVGHHGSRTSTGAAFLALVQPAYAVISAGHNNRYGHPHAEVMEGLEKAGVETQLTADEGTIMYVSDGKSFVRK